MTLLTFWGEVMMSCCVVLIAIRNLWSPRHDCHSIIVMGYDSTCIDYRDKNIHNHGFI